eukprot:12425047-Karenia_brevis.AAC.1
MSRNCKFSAVCWSLGRCQESIYEYTGKTEDEGVVQSVKRSERDSCFHEHGQPLSEKELDCVNQSIEQFRESHEWKKFMQNVAGTDQSSFE